MHLLRVIVLITCSNCVNFLQNEQYSTVHNMPDCNDLPVSNFLRKNRMETLSC